jgi:hypothetical protein
MAGLLGVFSLIETLPGSGSVDSVVSPPAGPSSEEVVVPSPESSTREELPEATG